jgi:hypothetical protein
MSVVESINEVINNNKISYVIFSYIYPFRYIGCEIEKDKQVCFLCNHKKVNYTHLLKNISNNKIVIIGTSCLETLFGKYIDKAQKYIKGESSVICRTCKCIIDKTEFKKYSKRIHSFLCYTCAIVDVGYIGTEEKRKKLENRIKRREEKEKLKLEKIEKQVLYNMLNTEGYCKIRYCHTKSYCYQCDLKIIMHNKGKNPYKLINKHCKQCKVKFQRKRYERYKKLCLTCYKNQ